MTCGQAPYQYSNLSRGKYESARYHLAEFEQLLAGPQSISDWRRGERFHNMAPVWAHSDGAILQLYGAFDSIACAIAHQFGLPDSRRASFGWQVLCRLPGEAEPLRASIRAVLQSVEWPELDELRNEAAHRGVLARYLAASASGAELYVDPKSVEQRRGAFSLVQRLVGWGEYPLRWFWLAAEEWRTWEQTILGSSMDLDAPPGTEF